MTIYEEDIAHLGHSWVDIWTKGVTAHSMCENCGVLSDEIGSLKMCPKRKKEAKTMGMESTPARQHRTLTITQTLDELWDAVGELETLKIEIVSKQDTGKIERERMHTPPLAELLESLPDHLRQIRNHIDTITAELRNALI